MLNWQRRALITDVYGNYTSFPKAPLIPYQRNHCVAGQWINIYVRTQRKWPSGQIISLIEGTKSILNWENNVADDNMN